MRSVDCAVVGGGFAGLAAARTAARHGVRVLLVDDSRELGGSGIRPRPGAPGQLAGNSPGRESHEVQPLVDAVTALGVELRLGTVAWDVSDQRTVSLATESTTERVVARALVLAPGAYDRPVPFPGWTLPGVMTAGGVASLMGAHGVLPGRRVLVAGTGPSLLELALALSRNGAEVAAICEASAVPALWRVSRRLLAHLDFAQREHHNRRAIRHAGVPLLPRHVIRAALGDGEVKGAVISRCDDRWRPIAGTERSLDVDTIIAGYGAVPSLELSRLAGCEHRYAPEIGSYVPVRTRDLETTAPNVFAIGDGARPAGSRVALMEGHLAGLVVAHRLGRLASRDYSREASRARGRLLHQSGLRRVIDDLYRFGSGIYSLADAATTLCRCEEVSAGEAVAAARDGASHVDEVKARTRIGMGRCQGRLCGPALAHLIAGETGGAVNDAGAFTVRPPARPVSLAALANETG